MARIESEANRMEREAAGRYLTEKWNVIMSPLGSRGGRPHPVDFAARVKEGNHKGMLLGYVETSRRRATPGQFPTIYLAERKVTALDAEPGPFSFPRVFVVGLDGMDVGQVRYYWIEAREATRELEPEDRGRRFDTRPGVTETEMIYLVPWDTFMEVGEGPSPFEESCRGSR